jgi:hypothetical protein
MGATIRYRGKHVVSVVLAPTTCSTVTIMLTTCGFRLGVSEDFLHCVCRRQ